MSLFDSITSYTYNNPIRMNENTPEQQVALVKSLIAFISEATDIAPDDFNPHFKNKFASLSAHLAYLKPLATKHGLAILQMPVGDIDVVGVRNIILHKDGGMMSSNALIPCDKGMQGQHAGSIYSYIRRYSLASIAGISLDDDDGETDRVVKTSSAPAGKFIPNKSYNGPKPTEVVSAPAPAPAVHSGAVPSGIADIDPSIPVPFGNNKGTPVGELSLNDLTYWATKWEPRPYEKTGKVTAKDAKLKATAVALYEMVSSGQSAGSDEVPF